MNIYTKTGDSGETGLFGGKRVPKTNPRLEAYGTVDELTAVIGVVRSYKIAAELNTQLETVQGQLMVIGSHLATPYNPAEDAPSTLPPLQEAWITDLEKQIDAMESVLPTLTNFILPGGSHAGAQLHVARTVCRRAERRIVSLTETEEINLLLMRFINRLSDYLFVAARFCNQEAGKEEQSWNS